MLLFAANLVSHFARPAKDNPVLYVECLFQHAQPHLACKAVTNRFVMEELLMLEEQGCLLEREQEEWEEDDASKAKDNNK